MSAAENATNQAMNNDNFAVILRGDLSIADLVAREQAGEAVMRSAHVGNYAMYNCVLADAGLRVVAYDRTVPARDRNYHPGYVVTGGEAQRVIDEADDEKLTTHVRTTAAVGRLAAGVSVVEAHMTSLGETFPQAQLSTMTEYFGVREGYVNDVVRLLAGHDFGLWNRAVDSDGRVTTSEQDMRDKLDSDGVFDGQPGGSGLLIPNSYNVFLTGVLDSLTYGTERQGAPEVTHISGPDMVSYIGKMSAELTAMYDVLREDKLGQHLPERLQYNLVPASHARWAVPGDRRATLEDMLAAFEAHEATGQALVAARAAVAKNPDMSKQEKADTFKELAMQQSEHRQSLSKVTALCPEVFTGTQDREHPTHYDVWRAQQQGQDFYVHPVALTQPLDELAKKYEPLLKVT